MTTSRQWRLAARPVGSGALQARARTGEHDGSAAATIDQCGDGRLHGVPHADQVDVDDVPEDLAAVATVAQPNNPGVGDDDVEAAEFLDAVAHDLLESVGVANVDLMRDDSAPLVLDELHRFVELIRGEPPVPGRDP